MVVLAAALPITAVGQDHGHGTQDRHPSSSVPLYDNLGNHHHPITTDDPRAQAYFDQGVRLTYGFNHAEALRSFEEATRLDPRCAMCWWGIAWAAGPNINAAMDSAGGVKAYMAAQKANEHAARATPKERAYIDAMAQRYAADPMVERAAHDTAYARVMRHVADRYADDDDAQVLAAEALMLLSPWNYWTEDNAPRSGTDQLLMRLASITERSREHAGACHFYIHAVEAAYPERAVPCAERIGGLMPGAGHIVHMPSHVFIRVGRYADAIEANKHAVHADEQYIADEPQASSYTLAYYPHNYHFLSFAATMAGHGALAIEASHKLAEKIDRTMLRAPGLGALQHYLVTPLRTYVRFGKWQEILAAAKPEADLIYPIGTWHYARGMAFARTSRLDDASRELTQLRAILDQPALEQVTVWDLNTATALLGVAAQVLAGEIAAARGDYAAAISELETGVKREAALTYDEPPPWDLPVRDVLGAVLLDAGRPADAEQVYRRALAKFPENGWALSGLHQSLTAQGKQGEAASVRTRLAIAWRTSDVTLETSRF